MYMGLNNFGNFDRYESYIRIKQNERNLIELEEKNYTFYFNKEIIL